MNVPLLCSCNIVYSVPTTMVNEYFLILQKRDGVRIQLNCANCWDDETDILYKYG